MMMMMMKLLKTFAPRYEKYFCPFVFAFFGILKLETMILRLLVAEWEFLVDKSIKYCSTKLSTDLNIMFYLIVLISTNINVEFTRGRIDYKNFVISIKDK